MFTRWTTSCRSLCIHKCSTLSLLLLLWHPQLVSLSPSPSSPPSPPSPCLYLPLSTSLYLYHVPLILSRTQAICGGQYYSEEEGRPVKCAALQVSTAFSGLEWKHGSMGLCLIPLSLQVCSCAGAEDGCQRRPWISPGSGHLLFQRTIQPSTRGTCTYPTNTYDFNHP